MTMTTLFATCRPRLIAASMALFAPLGCMVGPRYHPPASVAPPAFKETPPQESADGTLWKVAKPMDEASRGRWWEIYEEPELNDLEDRLNRSNQTIAQSYQNFVAAKALVRQARSNLYPILTAGPSYTRSRSSANLGGTRNSSSGQNLNSNEFNLPLDVSWEPDVWGKVRSQIKQSANQAQASAADLANTKLSEQASLAQYYFEIRGQDSLLAFYQKTVEAYAKSLELTKKLQTTGIDNTQDVAQANLNLQTALSALTNLHIARAQYEHAIALLLGEPASSFSLPVHELTTAAPIVPISVPSELLERRPDIAAAERTMAAANAQIAIQTAAFYPSFTISGEGGFQSSTIGNFLTWPSRFFSIGPSASYTIFDAGSRKAYLANYKAQYEADAASYRQTVLTAFQQTEDALASQHYLHDQLIQQQAAIDAAKKYLDIANVRYKAGIDPYLDVYTAQTSLLTQQQTFINLRVSQMTSNVQLIEALGGGWSASDIPTERMMATK